MMNIKAATYQWLVLLMLTTLSYGLGASSFSASATVLPVLLVTGAKGCIVIDRYMALRHVAGPWRMLLLAWLVIVLGSIWLSFTVFQP